MALTPVTATGQGLLYGGMPAYGPTLFGPNSVYSYNGGYDYGYPGYGYYAARRRGGPPPGTPSWWVEPRR